MAPKLGRHYAALPGLLLLLIMWAVPFAHAQVPRPVFDADIVSVRAQDPAQGTRVDVYTRIANKDLQFVSRGEGFRASYRVSASFYGVDDAGKRTSLIKTESWDHVVSAPSFAATQSSDLSDRSLGTLVLAPGRYIAVLRLEDLETRQAHVQEMPVHVRNLARPVAISDLVLIDDYDARQSTITPLVATALPTGRSAFKLFYEVYAGRTERVRIHREVVRFKVGNARSLRNIFGLVGSDEPVGEVTYTTADATQLKAGRSPFVVEIPMGALQAGEYRLRVRVENERGEVLDVAEKPITVEWGGLEEHVQNLAQAIEQLKYIAKDKELAYIRAGRDNAERLARFEAFWKKRDPTPGTERNERMEEYYYRIAYANRRYGNLGEGWSTDRGQVLVLFGEPDRIESQNADSKPYEVWLYNRIGRKFIFVDESGRGDFKLLIPIWDERNRLR